MVTNKLAIQPGWLAGILAALCLFLAAVPAHASELLVDPSGEKLCLLYYRLAKVAPPMDDFVAQSASVQRANEFDRDKKTAEEKARLQAVIASLADVKSLRINISMSLGTYDAQYGEYSLNGFGADEFISFQCFGNMQVHVRMDNAPYAQSWPLDKTAAEEVLKRNKGDRNIAAISTIELTGADTVAPNEPLVLVGKVREVSVLGEYNHVLLGQYTVPNK